MGKTRTKIRDRGFFDTSTMDHREHTHRHARARAHTQRTPCSRSAAQSPVSTRCTTWLLSPSGVCGSLIFSSAAPPGSCGGGPRVLACGMPGPAPAAEASGNRCIEDGGHWRHHRHLRRRRSRRRCEGLGCQRRRCRRRRRDRHRCRQSHRCEGSHGQGGLRLRVHDLRLPGEQVQASLGGGWVSLGLGNLGAISEELRRKGAEKAGGWCWGQGRS